MGLQRGTSSTIGGNKRTKQTSSYIPQTEYETWKEAFSTYTYNIRSLRKMTSQSKLQSITLQNYWPLCRIILVFTQLSHCRSTGVISWPQRAASWLWSIKAQTSTWKHSGLAALLKKVRFHLYSPRKHCCAKRDCIWQSQSLVQSLRSSGKRGVIMSLSRVDVDFLITANITHHTGLWATKRQAEG